MPRAPAGTLDLVLNLTNRHIHAQLLDKCAGTVRLAVHTNERVIRRALADEARSHYAGYATANVAAAERVGDIFGKRAAEAGIETVYWRAPGKYHGKIKAFIDAVRTHGITTLKAAPVNTPPVPDILN